MIIIYYRVDHERQLRVPVSYVLDDDKYPWDMDTVREKHDGKAGGEEYEEGQLPHELQELVEWLYEVHDLDWEFLKCILKMYYFTSHVSDFNNIIIAFNFQSWKGIYRCSYFR